MGKHFGGIAAAVALAAALVLALGVAVVQSRSIDYDTGTYTFTQPATDHVYESTVLVQDGVVTDVWISEADRENEYYGYTPQTPASAFRTGDDSAVTTVDGDTVRRCWFVGDEVLEHCTEFADVQQLSYGAAAALTESDGLDDGTYTLTTRSVTWEESSTHTLTIDGGVASGSGPELHALVTGQAPASPNWVRYWLNDGEEPFAVCHDEPYTHDEEECYEWSKAP